MIDQHLTLCFYFLLSLYFGYTYPGTLGVSVTCFSACVVQLCGQGTGDRRIGEGEAGRVTPTDRAAVKGGRRACTDGLDDGRSTGDGQLGHRQAREGMAGDVRCGVILAGRFSWFGPQNHGPGFLGFRLKT